MRRWSLAPKRGSQGRVVAIRNGDQRILEIYLKRAEQWMQIQMTSDEDVDTSTEKHAIRPILNYGADCVTLHCPVPTQ
jgi:hypothetical protein